MSDVSDKLLVDLHRQMQRITASACIAFGSLREESPACWDCPIAKYCGDLTQAPARIAALQDIAELPKFLTSIFPEVRELAVQRLKELMANDCCGEAPC